MEILIPVAMLLATLYVLVQIAFAGGRTSDREIRNTDFRRPS